MSLNVLYMWYRGASRKLPEWWKNILITINFSVNTIEQGASPLARPPLNTQTHTHTHPLFSCHTEGGWQHRTSSSGFDWPAEQNPRGWLTPYDSMPWWIEHRKEMHVCWVRVIDIHGACADTFPYETVVSPVEGTCEALHPDVGYQALNSPFDPQTKRSVCGIIHTSLDGDWQSFRWEKKWKWKALKGTLIPHQCRCTLEVFCCFQVLP